MSLQPGDRRKRVRAATVDDITAAARALVVEHGPAGVSLRAIARAMGMTAPALYRYFPSLEELLGALCQSSYNDLSSALEQARDSVGDDPGLRLLVVSLRFRSWAAENPKIFELTFGAPLPGVRDQVTPKDLAGMRFALVFTELFVQIWQRSPFPVQEDETLPEDLLRQLLAFRENLGHRLPGALDLPPGAFLVFLRAWVQLYGVVTMEAFGHLDFCLDDAAPFFWQTLVTIGASMGIDESIAENLC